MRILYANVNLYHILLRKFSKCSVDVKCFLFKTNCSNLYCAPMWFDNCTKLRCNEKVENCIQQPATIYVLAIWRNSATEMFVKLGIHSFDEMLRIFVFSFRSRVTASHNQLVCSLCSAHCSVYSKLHVGMVEQLSTYIVNTIIYLMHLLYANLYFCSFCIYFI